MTVIWGLDLKEIQWSKFKNSNMWNNMYYRRRTKFGVYQLAMILCVVSESLGTDALSQYLDQKRLVAATLPRLPNGEPVREYNRDIVGSFSYNIFAGVFVATIFGAAFFFDLFWPERRESKAVKLAWRICSVLASIFALSSAINLTVILVTRRARLSTPSMEKAITVKPALTYRKNGEAVASVVLIWLGWLATVWATVLMWRCISHIDRYGPFSKHARPMEPKPTDHAARLSDDVPVASESNPHTHEAQPELAKPTEAARPGEGVRVADNGYAHQPNSSLNRHATAHHPGY
ncbi:hypothetical protein EJ06DRAFT_471809 [Trichodelitschia bisporula]|uniref:MARVEL domain-containing protein n=1 Tax=Trichodelitschia bisporula TaxID=703511 RepID=A0A6G1I607_9PEZI|nr:hypothetical protein EJ06DRAFT_471809 [Trichodelitschia bisporula]